MEKNKNPYYTQGRRGNFFLLKGTSITLKCISLPRYSQISTLFVYSEKNLILKISSFYNAVIISQKPTLY